MLHSTAGWSAFLRSCGVITREDPRAGFSHPTEDRASAPPFLLYDCSSRPEARPLERLEYLPCGLPKILVNHLPLQVENARLPRKPRFSPGVRHTGAVVYGHLHIRGTTWPDGIPFQKVSLGIPPQWRQDLDTGSYLHEVMHAPATRSAFPSGNKIQS